MLELSTTNRLARRMVVAAALAALLWPASRLAAQPPATTQPAAAVPGPAVGDVAPDFALHGVTRYGALKDPVRLSDFRGQTVVLAFFYKARTKG